MNKEDSCAGNRTALKCAFYLALAQGKDSEAQTLQAKLVAEGENEGILMETRKRGKEFRADLLLLTGLLCNKLPTLARLHLEGWILDWLDLKPCARQFLDLARAKTIDSFEEWTNLSDEYRSQLQRLERECKEKIFKYATSKASEFIPPPKYSLKLLPEPMCHSFRKALKSRARRCRKAVEEARKRIAECGHDVSTVEAIIAQCREQFPELDKGLDKLLDRKPGQGLEVGWHVLKLITLQKNAFCFAPDTYFRVKTNNEFPITSKTLSDRHPLFVLKDEGNQITACPCTSQTKLKKRYIIRGCCFNDTDYILKETTYILGNIPFRENNPPPESADIGYRGIVPMECIDAI